MNYGWLQNDTNSAGWHKTLRNTSKIPSHAYTLQLAMQNRLSSPQKDKVAETFSANIDPAHPASYTAKVMRILPIF